MSYPKKATPTKASPAKNTSKLTEEKREKLLAIQEKEQLKGLLVNKFLDKYGKEKKVDQTYVNKHVNEFMKNEKVTEENLKKLEQKIREGANIKNDALSQKSVKSPKNQPDSLSVVSQNNKQSPQEDRCDDAISVSSSQKPKSVYAQGESDDEWATILRYDAELYKKEKALEKVREQELKKRSRKSWIDKFNRRKQQKQLKMKSLEDMSTSWKIKPRPMTKRKRRRRTTCTTRSCRRSTPEIDSYKRNMPERRARRRPRKKWTSSWLRRSRKKSAMKPELSL
jgi:hypothetical protein